MTQASVAAWAGKRTPHREVLKTQSVEVQRVGTRKQNPQGLLGIIDVHRRNMLINDDVNAENRRRGGGAVLKYLYSLYL